MCIMTESALRQKRRLMSMHLRKALFLVTSETRIGLKSKTSATTQFVALCALDFSHRRMLPKSFKTRRWVWPHKEMYVFPATLPNQRE